MGKDFTQIAGSLKCLALLCHADPELVAERLTGVLWEPTEKAGIMEALAQTPPSHLVPQLQFTPLFAEILQELTQVKDSALNLQMAITEAGDDEASLRPNPPDPTPAQLGRSAYHRAIGQAHGCVYMALYILKNPDLPHFVANRVPRNKDSP